MDAKASAAGYLEEACANALRAERARVARWLDRVRVFAQVAWLTIGLASGSASSPAPTPPPGE